MKKYEYVDVLNLLKYLRFDLLHLSANYSDPLPLLLARVDQVFGLGEEMLKTDLTSLQRFELRKEMKDNERYVEELVYRKYL